MDPRHLLQIASSLKPNSRLEWTKHLSKHPDHAVKIVAIQSATVALTVVGGGLAWVFRG